MYKRVFRVSSEYIQLEAGCNDVSRASVDVVELEIPGNWAISNIRPSDGYGFHVIEVTPPLHDPVLNSPFWVCLHRPAAPVPTLAFRL